MAKEKIISKVIPLTLGVLAFVLLIGYLVFAWQEPTQAPPGGNVPAPINVGTTSQYKAGGLRIGGAFQSDSIGVFNSGLKISNSPLQESGVIRWSGSDFQGYTGSSWLSLTAGGGGVPLERIVRVEKCLAQGISNVLCKKIDGSGNCINQASGEDLYSECPSGYKCNGAGSCALTIGKSCSASSQCASGYCVNGVCCDSACNDKTCQRCDSYSVNGVGQCGYVKSSSEDPDNECSSSGCSGSDYCSGTSYSCGAAIPYGQDPNNACGGSSCCGYCNGAGACAYVASGSTCSSPGDACGGHSRCDGGGGCTTPIAKTGISTDHYDWSCNSVCSNAGYAGCGGGTYYDCGEYMPYGSFVTCNDADGVSCGGGYVGTFCHEAAHCDNFDSPGPPYECRDRPKPATVTNYRCCCWYYIY